MSYRRSVGRSHARYSGIVLATVTLFANLAAAPPALGADVGFPLYAQSVSGTITGEKPQSKVWYHDGTWWTILHGPSGLAFYEKTGAAWTRSTFIDAVVLPSGEADVKWDGTRLYVLVYANTPRLFEYTYQPADRAYQLIPGFPVSVPRPSGSETMVLESDSQGRLWVTAEGNNKVNVYYTTSADHRTWSQTPVILQSGIDVDDITSIVAFGGDKIGVFWSDQVRDEFGFCIHRDGDDPTVWQPIEIASSGAGHADDHIHLANDASGRVYAITKDDFDLMMVHRRELDGTWTRRADVTGGVIGTRGIIMVSDEDQTAHIVWTDWKPSPDRIAHRSASFEDLHFGSTMTFMATSLGDLNNVSSSKHALPAGQLVAVAEGAGRVWWNSIGSVTPSDLPPPGAPVDLAATLSQGPPPQVDLAWSPPVTGTPDGYYVDRQVGTGSFVRLTPTLWTGTTYVDPNVVAGTLTYRITAFQNQQSGPPVAVSVTYVPPPPPAPLAPTAMHGQVALPNGAAAYRLDEGTGQVVADATGRGHPGHLGTKPIADTSDPVWAPGLAGTALRFDGSNDHVRVPDMPDLRFPGSFTVEAWIQRTKTGSAHTILAKGDSSRRNFQLEIDATNRIMLRWQSKTKDKGTISAFTITDAGWHHIAGVYDMERGENRIYVDGVLVHRAPDTAIPSTNTDPLFIGAKTTSGTIKTTFAGLIDMPRVFAGARYLEDFTPETEFQDGGSMPVIQVAWLPPAGPTPAGYHVDRAQEDGSFVRMTTALVTGLQWADFAPPAAGACYRITAYDALGQSSESSELACAPPMETAAKVVRPAPAALPDPGLELRVGPNPFNPTTTIRFRAVTASRVRCAIYDVRGRRVALLADEERAAGEHAIVWNAGTQAASGTYFLLLQVGNETARQKLLLIE